MAPLNITGTSSLRYCTSTEGHYQPGLLSYEESDIFGSFLLSLNRIWAGFFPGLGKISIVNSCYFGLTQRFSENDRGRRVARRPLALSTQQNSPNRSEDADTA